MNKLKELRQEKNLTQSELGEIFGVSKMTVLRWENGENQIKPEKAEALAKYFNVSVGYLLGYSENLLLEEETVKKIASDFNGVVKIEPLRSSLSDKELMELPPEERKKYISNYLDSLNLALSNLADTLGNVGNLTAGITSEQLGKITDSMIQTLAELNKIKGKQK